MSNNKTPKITGVMIRLYSFRDRSGNVYEAFAYTDTQSGISCNGFGDNIFEATHYFDKRDPYGSRILKQNVGMTCGAFNRLTKGWGYAGCSGVDIHKRIKASIRRQKRAAKKQKKA